MDDTERYWVQEIDARIARAMEEAGLELQPAESNSDTTVYEGGGIRVEVNARIEREKPEPVVLSLNPKTGTIKLL